MIKRNLIFVTASLVAASLWGCGSNYSSGGDQTGADTTLANAAAVGMDNCLTCHSAFSQLVQDYMVSRHGNHLTGGRVPNDALDILDPLDPIDPSPGLTTCSLRCHDPYGDGVNVNLVEAQAALVAFGNDTKADWTVAAQIIGCEACHGGGQFHNGIAAGIPYATPGPAQCGKCHGATLALAEAGPWGSEHLTSSSGNNVRRNIMDSHYDNPATSEQSADLNPADPLFAANKIEGYVIRASQQTGCVDCHFNGHSMDLTKNYQWARSGHAGGIKTIKDAALAAGAADATTLLANVTAAGAPAAAVFADHDWDGGSGSCQVCHTATGISNFLASPATYDLTGAGNNYSHLAGWSRAANGTVTPSGQNELLYCWGCHSDSKGTLRNPGAIPLSYTYNSVIVTLPDVGDSNVCVKCHGGRGNLDTILANVAAADVSLTDTVNRSTRSAEHHAPTAASLFAAQTHTTYEYTGMDYSGAPAHAGIDPAGSGPCASCHMGGATELVTLRQDHTFEATTHDVAGAITTIVHEPTCNTLECHDATMSVAALQDQKDGFTAAKTVLSNLLKNSPVNYLGLNIATTSNNNYKTVPVGAYGAFMINAYLGEDPCAYVHNNLYTRRVLYDSIKFLKDGNLTGTLDLTGFAAAAEFISPGYGAIATIARPGDVG